jgi:hypothetical protein
MDVRLTFAGNLRGELRGAGIFLFESAVTL